MIIVSSSPARVIAQCHAGIVGCMPALNARTDAQLDEWLGSIVTALADFSRAHPEQQAATRVYRLINEYQAARIALDPG